MNCSPRNKFYAQPPPTPKFNFEVKLYFAAIFHVKNCDKAYFNQHLACPPPKPWSKYGVHLNRQKMQKLLSSKTAKWFYIIKLDHLTLALQMEADS